MLVAADFRHIGRSLWEEKEPNKDLYINFHKALRIPF
jgi:hypothetical protein